MEKKQGILFSMCRYDDNISSVPELLSQYTGFGFRVSGVETLRDLVSICSGPG